MKTSTRLLAALVLILPRPTLAQRDAKVPDPDPELERQSFQIAEGFEVNLFASESTPFPAGEKGGPSRGIGKPLQMNFDPQGRLWVVSSEVYPQILPGQEANDRVLILEDRDGDGRAETTTVFADGLLIPTGIEPGDGGAYVANSTELLHLKDADGDGKADARRVVLSGFGTEDTHHILHTLRWGGDGMLYFNQSTYIHSHIETPYGVRRLGGGGIWQFRPETMRLEVFTRGLINPWGHHFDRWGQDFATDGAGGEGINYMVPGASYAWTPGESRILPGLNPGSPKHCGAEVLSGRHLPEGWRGNILTNDFRANRVCRFVLSDDGSGFASREQPELLKTPHVAFRPIDVKMGPDGAIYVADWYNPIIQHGEVDFRDPRRDHTRGRIWRVTARGRPLVERPRLVGASTEALLEALKAPEDWTRQQAKRVLKERGAERVIPALAGWVKGLDPMDPEVEHHRLEALWTYQSLDVVEPGLVAALAGSTDPRVRATAVRVAGAWHDRLPDPLALLESRVTDEHPRVRLEAVRALAVIPTAESAALALRALDRPLDRFLDYALWLTCRELSPRWLPALQAGRFDAGGDSGRLAFALQAAGSPAVVGPLLGAIQSGTIPEGRRADVLKLVGALGTPEELARGLALALGDGANPARRAEGLAALVQGSEPRGLKPSGGTDGLDALLADPADEGSAVAACRAVGAWRLEGLRPRLAAKANDVATREPVRLAAIDALARLGGEASVGPLDRLSKSDGPASVRRRAVVGLAAIDPEAASRRAEGVLTGARDGEDTADLFLAFVGRRGGPSALAAALADRTLPPDVAKVGLRVARQSGRVDASLVEALTKAGGLTGKPIELSTAEMDAMVADVRSQGDPARGERVFRRADLACLKCHAIAGAGGQVGPGLESIGASAPVDYLVTSTLDPDKAIKEGYHSLVVATSEGRVVSGIKVRQTDAELVLRDGEGREVAVPTAEVEDQKPGGSLMPSGLTDALTRSELADLVRFLSELGKVGPYSVGQARVVRRWRALVPSAETVGVVNRLGLGAAARDQSPGRWMPAYSLVSGVLPTEDLPTLELGPAKRVAVVAAQFEVTTPGAVRLRLDPTAASGVWVDGQPRSSGGVLDLDLSSGRHTLTMAVEPRGHDKGLRCEVEDVPGSPARVQVVGGK